MFQLIDKSTAGFKFQHVRVALTNLKSYKDAVLHFSDILK